jgi:hypothetical protein
MTLTLTLIMPFARWRPLRCTCARKAHVTGRPGARDNQFVDFSLTSEKVSEFCHNLWIGVWGGVRGRL